MKEFTSENYTIILGMNREENDKLVRNSHPEDVWLHLEEGSSPHAIIQTSERINSKMLRNASRMIKENSRAKNEKVVRIIWTRVINLVPTEKLGEVQIKGGTHLYIF